MKNWGLLMRPGGPGDIFRLLHGLQTKFEQEERCIICAPHDIKNVATIMAKTREQLHSLNRSTGWRLWSTGTTFWLVLDQVRDNGDETERKICTYLLAWKSCFKREPFAFGSRNIWTSYSDARHKQAGYMKKVPGRIRRIDTQSACGSFSNHKANFPGVPEYKPPATRIIQIAVVLRQARQDSWRNSPDYHRDQRFLRSQLIGRKCKFQFFGFKDAKDCRWPRNARCNPYDELSLLEQIGTAQKFHLAIGVNSAVLDVFAIAGVPVLRECEFQAVKPSCQFGWRYNSFLATSLNVGLGIKREWFKTENWNDRKRFARYLQLLVRITPGASIHLWEGVQNTSMSGLRQTRYRLKAK